MALDPAVRNVRVRERFAFGERFEAIKTIVYDFFVGKSGPFTEDFADGQDFPEAVERRINERVAKLRAIGALTPEGE